ncbi:MAG TPA: sialidase family protein [Paludibacter sp.]|nr:MAG: hypothetical protein BWY08_01825 [Bacteroidetes bacterium ADurb.Bin174]HQB27407.1 sialidase family protein [Paludibacter sp.]
MSIKKIILSSLCFIVLVAAAQVNTSYACFGTDVVLDIEWKSDNNGTIQWQNSTDGTSWTDIRNANAPTHNFRMNGEIWYRATINTQEECVPTHLTYHIKQIGFDMILKSVSANSAVFDIQNADFQDAEIVAYGFSYNISAYDNRDYSQVNRIQAGTSIPNQPDFEITCEHLTPGTAYTIRAYFQTAQGDIIYSQELTPVTTTAGLKWSNENWLIGSTEIAASCEIAGSVAGNPTVTFKFGTSETDLQTKSLTSLGNKKYRSVLITDLLPNTTYFAQAEIIIGGQRQIISKEIKTLPDYSGVAVERTKSASHTIRWDATQSLQSISPAGLLTEYPRIIRVSEDTLLCAYHGGNRNHWVNIYLQKSFDNGLSWTTPVELISKENSTIGQKYWRFVNPEMIKLQNGWILMSFIGNGNPESNENCHVMVMLSKDNGETWDDPRIIGRGRTWEPMVVQLPNGELELLVASEAAWWQQGVYLAQEILCSRSTDNGETWTAFERAAYSPDRRDGMPVAVALQGNKGILFAIETVDDQGFGSPSLVHRPLNGEWDTNPWNGISTNKRWKVNINGHGGAPYIVQLSTGEIVLVAHTGGRNGIWQTGFPRVVIGNSAGLMFGNPVTPLTRLPENEGAYYNSLFVKDEETIWLLTTYVTFENDVRKKSEIKYLEGKIVKR